MRRNIRCFQISDRKICRGNSFPIRLCLCKGRPDCIVSDCGWNCLAICSIIGSRTVNCSLIAAITPAGFPKKSSAYTMQITIKRRYPCISVIRTENGRIPDCTASLITLFPEPGYEDFSNRWRRIYRKPSALKQSTEHDKTGVPSKSTVQSPQFAVSQPRFTL